MDLLINKKRKKFYLIFQFILLLICSLTAYCQNTNEIKTFQELLVDKERAMSLKVTHSNTPSSALDYKSEFDLNVIVKKTNTSNFYIEIEIPLNELNLDTFKLSGKTTQNLTLDFFENEIYVENWLDKSSDLESSYYLIIDIISGINFLLEVLTTEIDKTIMDTVALRDNLSGNLNFNVVRSKDSIQLIETFMVSNDSYRESLISKIKENSEKYNFDDQETNHALNLINNSESKFITESNVLFNTKTNKLDVAKRIITQETKFQNLEKSLSNTIIILTEK